MSFTVLVQFHPVLGESFVYSNDGISGGITRRIGLFEPDADAQMVESVSRMAGLTFGQISPGPTDFAIGQGMFAPKGTQTPVTILTGNLCSGMGAPQALSLVAGVAEIAGRHTRLRDGNNPIDSLAMVPVHGMGEKEVADLTPLGTAAGKVQGLGIVTGRT
jgi:hypothetical protein